MKNVGSLLVLIGLLGTVYFGWHFYESYTSISVLGAEVSIWNEDDLVPLLISVIVLLGGAWLRKTE